MAFAHESVSLYYCMLEPNGELIISGYQFPVGNVGKDIPRKCRWNPDVPG
jgi:hypothetical protein